MNRYLLQIIECIGIITLLLSLAGCAGYGTPNKVQANDATKQPTSRSNKQHADGSVASLQISTNLLPNGTVQVPYTMTLGATGGVSPYSWSLNSGSLPSGLSLNSSSGAISGMPSQAGGYTFTVQVKDSRTEDGEADPHTATKTFTINITNTAPLQITSNSLAGGQVSASYLVALTATGGTLPYTWSVLSGSLPSGLSLNTSIGAISGTPSQAGTFTFALQLKDANGQTSQQSFSLVIAAAAATVVPLSINTPGLPGGITQKTYAGTLSASGGTTPYAWSVTSGSLPPGLNLNASTGAITGTPTTTGTFNFTVQARDSSPTPQTASASASVLIVAPLQIATTSLPPPQLQTSYSATLAVSGGMPPYVWGISSGSLPSGLTLNSSTGVLSGVPTTVGSYTFTVQVADPPSIPQTATAQLTTSVSAPALQITSSSLPGGQVQVAYSAALAASGGTAPYNWSAVSGSLPVGLSLNALTGAISGTPSASGSYSFTAQVKDAAGATASRTYAVTIASPPPPAPLPLAITTTVLATGTVGTPYSAQLQASGGSAPYTWALTSGALPPALSLSAAGVISGTPSGAGNYNFAVSVRDSSPVAQTASGGFTLTVTAPPSTPPPGAGTYTSRTDLSAAPETIPTLCSPAPCTMTSSDLNANLKYTRVTDGSTDVYPSHAGSSWDVSNSLDNLWSIDQSTFLLEGFLLGQTVFKFNSSTQLASIAPCTYDDGLTSCIAGKFSPANFFSNADLSYSWVTPNIIYGFSGSVLKMVDFRATLSNPATPPTVTSLADANSCPSIPNTANNPGITTVSSDDTRYASAFGGIQDQKYIIYVFDTVQGCRWLRTDTFTIGGQWGPTGTVVYHDQNGNVISNRSYSTIHSAFMDPTGRWVVIGMQSSPEFQDFWDIATLNMYQCNVTNGDCSGHAVMGFDNIFLNDGYTSGVALKRVFPPAEPTTAIGTNQPAGFVYTQDLHFSWKNAVAGQLKPVTVSYFNTFAPTTAWQDEIVGAATDGSNIVWRFAHTYTRATTYHAQGLHQVSHDGKWAFFSSDWGGSSRVDVFLVPLK